MKQYLERYNEQEHTCWEIELKGKVLLQKSGVVGQEGSIEQQELEDEAAAFGVYQAQIIARMEDGYTSPKAVCEMTNFKPSTFQGYLEQGAWEEAIAWLEYYPWLPDAQYEDSLVATLLEKQNYTLGERYVLNRIKDNNDLTQVSRYIRYLSQLNPMLCRFMIGNLPPTPTVADPLLYYKNLGRAQARIGMIGKPETLIEGISSQVVQLYYLGSLLDYVQEDTAAQQQVLWKAMALMEQYFFDITDEKTLYELLLEGAEKLKAQPEVERLRASLDQLPLDDQKD